MNVKKIITILLILGTISYSGNIAADESDSTKFRVFKIFTNASYKESKTTRHLGYYYTNNIAIKNYNYSFGDVSFAFEFGKRKKISHEFEVMPYSFTDNEVSDYRMTYFESYARYQLNYSFVDRSSKLRPFIGVAIGAIYSKSANYSLNPVNYYLMNYSNYYTSKNNEFMFPIDFVPGINIRLSNRFHFVIIIPIRINNIVIERVHVSYLNSQPDAKYFTDLYNVFMPKVLCVKLGISYVIGKRIKNDDK